jgi:hypothetical protein
MGDGRWDGVEAQRYLTKCRRRKGRKATEDKSHESQPDALGKRAIGTMECLEIIADDRPGEWEWRQCRTPVDPPRLESWTEPSPPNANSSYEQEHERGQCIIHPSHTGVIGIAAGIVNWPSGSLRSLASADSSQLQLTRSKSRRQGGSAHDAPPDPLRHRSRPPISGGEFWITMPSIMHGLRQ